MCEKGMQKVMEHVVRTRGSSGEDVNRESHRRSHNIYAKVRVSVDHCTESCPIYLDLYSQREDQCIEFKALPEDG